MTLQPPLIRPCKPAIQVRDEIKLKETTAKKEMQRLEKHINVSEVKVRAWSYLNWDLVKKQADTIDQKQKTGQLAGVAVGIKDIIDTSDQPTENGTISQKGRKPVAEATVVKRLRKEDAIILGKTVTTECACGISGKTRNPHNPLHTPGGSSSGSAAAVASGMVPVALGTQTAGSVIRPAAFCGTWAMLPSAGTLPRTGVLKLSDTFDRVGVFAMTPHDIALTIDALSGKDKEDLRTFDTVTKPLSTALKESACTPRLAFLESFKGINEKTNQINQYRELAAKMDANIINFGDQFLNIGEAHRTVMLTEVSQNLWPLYKDHANSLSPMLCKRIVDGRKISASEYLEMKDLIKKMSAYFNKIMKNFDGLITSPAPGEAPRGLANTGSRMGTLPWTTVGSPVINIPGMSGKTGLPLGIQLVGRRYGDDSLIRAAQWIAKKISVTLEKKLK